MAITEEEITWKKIPVTGDPFRNVAEAELDGVSAAVQDAYVTELDHTARRPGWQDWQDLGTSLGVDGLHWSDKHQMVFSVSNGRVWKHTDLTGTATELTGASLSAGNRVTFTEDGTRILMANGAQMVHAVPSTTTLVQMADADAPTAVRFVDFIDGYILALLDATARFQCSDLNNMLSWTASNLFTASGRPDNAVALKVGWREIFIAGKDSCEVWVNDGTNPFSRLSNGLIERGCSAAQTLKQVGNVWVWLDERRRFVQLTSREPEELNFPFDADVQMFNAVDDAIADVVAISGQVFYVVTFPSAQKTYAYNVKKNSWTEWGSWNTATGSYRRFRMQAYCYARGWNKHLVGDYSNGKIYEMRPDLYSDAGDPIRSFRRTGVVSHGTNSRKRSHELIVRCRRGVANASIASPKMVVRWREGGGAWSNEHELSLGEVGQHTLQARLHRLGIYRARQYEFIVSDPCAWTFVEAEEKVEFLGS